MFIDLCFHLAMEVGARPLTQSPELGAGARCFRIDESETMRLPPVGSLSHKQKWLLVPVASHIAAHSRKELSSSRFLYYIRFQRKVSI
jgi:hypothetical protein